MRCEAALKPYVTAPLNYTQRVKYDYEAEKYYIIHQGCKSADVQHRKVPQRNKNIDVFVIDTNVFGFFVRPYFQRYLGTEFRFVRVVKRIRLQ